MLEPARPIPETALLLALVAALLLSACTSGGAKRAAGVPPAPPVQIVEEAEVTKCTYVKDVTGAPGLSGLIARWSATAAQTGLEKAQRQALRSAKEAGATHVVWMPRGYESVHVKGKAYHCP